MKRSIVFVMLSSLVICLTAPAQDSGFGLGVILGEPTGVCFKHWTGYNTALVGAAAWAFRREDAFHLHLDYLFHSFRLIKAERHEIPFYYGIGFRFKDERNDRLGVRFPLGIIFMFDDVPLDVFFEIVPIFDLAPRTELSFNGGVGIRYFF
ncbi:MAG: hypothetical protein JXB23_15615 [Candidatus Aminicenantes bacterium]|nr:hypothetical protein [Candidatus Aminicenantes bacterium]